MSQEQAMTYLWVSSTMAWVEELHWLCLAFAIINCSSPSILCTGIQALLSNAPRRLLSLGLDGMRSFDDCSRMEHAYRKEKERIDRLFPKDAEILISMAKNA